MRGRGPKYNGQLSDGWALAGPWAALGVGLILARTAKKTQDKADMKFVQNFTPPDFQVKNFTPSISPNFNSFSKKKHKK